MLEPDGLGGFLPPSRGELVAHLGGSGAPALLRDGVPALGYGTDYQPFMAYHAGGYLWFARAALHEVVVDP